MRLLLWVLLAPFRLTGWLFRRLYLAFWGYSVLTLHLHGRLRDRPRPFTVLGAWSGEPPGPALLEVLLALDRARKDPRIRAVFVRLGPLRTGLARAEELRAALGAIRDAGKRVVVHLEEGGLAEYSVALGASEIVMPPGGSLNVTGVTSEVVFLKGLLDRVGVRAWFRARGKYKTARETFAEPGMTPANREMTEAIVGDLFEQLVQAVAESRKLPPEAVRERLDRGPFSGPIACELGLVDTVLYVDEVEERLKVALGRYRPLGLRSYLRFSEPALPRRPRAVIALVEVSGPIKSGSSVPGRATGSRKFVEVVERLAKHPRIDAILLRVDSPGGSALASDLMWHALDRARKKKPIVVSMADVAASGGYFVSGIREAPIFASEATITGSIGVLAGKFDASALYEKLGVKKEIVGAGRHAGFFSEARGFTEEEAQKLEDDVDEHYRHFLSRMAEGRARSVDEVRAVAEGRVFTGRQALSNGLVDERGGLLPALVHARMLLGLEPDARIALARTAEEARPFPLRIEWRLPESRLPEEAQSLLRLSDWFRAERVLALLPFDVRFL